MIATLCINASHTLSVAEAPLIPSLPRHLPSQFKVTKCVSASIDRYKTNIRALVLDYSIAQLSCFLFPIGKHAISIVLERLNSLKLLV